MFIRFGSYQYNVRTYVLGEAFKTLSVYQKCLEKERKKWIKNGRKMDVHLVTTIAKSLRKIYAITKQNMDLLDKAVVQSFVENFPNECTKIEEENIRGKISLNGKTKRIRGGIKRLSKEQYGRSKKVKLHELSNDI